MQDCDSGVFTDDVRLASAKDSMVRMRTKLLDITKSNSLVSFRHSERARTQVRLVAGTVDGIYDALAAGKVLRVDSLPPRDDEPADERTEAFSTRLDAARLSDEDWARDIAAIPEGADDEHAQVARAERRLRNRVRKSLGLPETSKAVVNVAEHARRNGVDPSFELAPEGEPSDGLQTLLFPDVHERKLAGVRASAQSALADLGVNTLFAAFGFLEWYESEDSDRPLIAPLLLLPVALDRKLHYTKYVYTLGGLDGDLEVNVSLSERLNHDWNFVLPELGEEEAPSSYIARVDKLVKRHDRRWRVRTFVTVGHFAFARIAMYHDLDPFKWPTGAPIEGSSIILSMLGGGTGGGSSGSVFAPEHDVESDEAERLVPVLVTDADSSQHSAIMDALSGKNLVIEGPPGTGKSQTITNLIAAALANGKTVLFVAEKMPALQVVKSRLDAAGLGHFCLELHSGRTKRRDVVASLQKRLEMTAERGDERRLEGSLRELRALRSRLSAYADALNKPLGNGLTGHDALWGDQRRRFEEDSATARRLDALLAPGIEREDADRIAVLGGLLESFENTMASLSDGNPWTAVRNASMSPADVEPVARMAGDLSAEIARLVSDVSDLARFGFDLAATLAEHRATCDGVAALASTPWKVTGSLVGLTEAGRIERLAAWRSAFSVVIGARSRIAAADFGGGAGDARLADLGPGEAAATANAIAEVLDALAEWCPDLGTVERLPELAAESDAAAARLATLSVFLSKVGTCLGTEEARPSVVAAVLDLAARIEADLGYATAEMVDQTVAETLADAQRRAAALSEQAFNLALSIDMESDLDAARLRSHAEAIEGAGMFGFLKPSVRAARRYWKTVTRDAAGQPVAVMRKTADHLDAVAAFESDPAFLSAFGRRWRGRETDFERTNKVVAWAKAVRSALDRLDPSTARIRADFLRLDTEYLEDLAAIARDERAELLRDGVEGRLDVTDDVAGHSAWHARCRDYLISLRDILAQAGVTSGPMEAVAELVADLRRIADAEPRLHDEALAPFCTDSEGQFDGERAAELVEFGTRLRQAGLPDGTVAAILAMGADGLLSSIAPASALLASGIDALCRGWNGFAKTVDLDVRTFCDADTMEGAKLPVLVERLDAAAADPTALASWTRHLSTRRRAVDAGLGDLCALREEDDRWKGLPAVLERTWYRKMASDLFRRHPALTDYNGTEQDDARANFRELDRRIMTLQRAALSAKLGAARIPPGSDYGKKAQWTELALIQHETTKKQKHVPVRHLVSRARNALVAMKPCFMMSPLTVAQYLPKSGLTFDLVVIDEASQMKPEDAMGAMARGRQTVIVGDPQQLPPSKFFAASTGSGDGDEEEDDASDLESILDLASATFRPKRRLRWHYRSRHGSLIAFSNRNFYEDDLVVFPSPTERMEGAGVTTRFVEDGAYRNRTNLPEAQAVCREALLFIRANPNRSLGIVAINAVQAQLIRDEMDRVFSDNPDAEEWRLSWEGTLEPFICKALEMIQGDERDAIFITTVYGRNADGKVSNNFGEINKAAGHRRLNVLFTRAKHAVRLFTSLRPEDVRLTEKTPRGTRMLHEYLRFAQSGKLDGGTVTDRESDSDFEIMVAEMLRARGFEVVPQVGVSGFRIDLAVRDQDVPGGFLAGIECDGASYHSSKSARDRDRLRQEVLEGLGWTIYRIWSTDWYRDPRTEADKAAAFLKDVRRTRKTPDHALFRPFAETGKEARPSEREQDRAAPAAAFSVHGRAAQSAPSADKFSGDLFSPPPAAPAKTASKAASSLQDRLGALAAKIDREVGAVPVERHILRPEARDIFIRKMPESASQFRTVVPLAMREKIEPRHMRYLEEILDTLAD